MTDFTMSSATANTTIVGIQQALHESAIRVFGGENVGDELLSILDTYSFRAFTAMQEGDMEAVGLIPDQILATFEARRIAAHKEKWALLAAAAHGVFSMAIRLTLA